MERMTRREILNKKINYNKMIKHEHYSDRDEFIVYCAGSVYRHTVTGDNKYNANIKTEKLGTPCPNYSMEVCKRWKN